MSMSDKIKGSIKILENKIILRKDGKLETWIKTGQRNEEWIKYGGFIYELDKIKNDTSE